MRDGETKFHAQIGRSLRRFQESQRLLHCPKIVKLAFAAIAGRQMIGNLMHLLSADSAIQIVREEGPDLDAISRDHSVTASLDARVVGEGAELFTLSAPAATSKARRADRPRIKRDFTVPRWMSNISAISSYVNPSISRRMTTFRNASGN